MSRVQSTPAMKRAAAKVRDSSGSSKLLETNAAFQVMRGKWQVVLKFAANLAPAKWPCFVARQPSFVATIFDFAVTLSSV